jgi:hypothetical protein
MTKMVSIQGQQRWEYCVETRFTEIPFLAILNERGQQGWEAVNAMHHKDAKGSNVWTALLKRPSIGPMPASDQQSATSAATEPSDPAAEPAASTDESRGFDLSDKEFQLKEG